jgi:hypothetical protein
MRKTALFASTLVLGLAGTAAADQLVDTNGDGYADTTIDSTYGYQDDSYYDDTYYDESTYPTTETYGAWVTAPIPAPQVVSVRPRPGFVWVEGYWRWTGYEWSWVNGYWLRERPNYLYVQGRWDVNRGRHRWVSGYWKARPRVIIRDHRHDHRHHVRDRWDRRDRHDRWDRHDRRDDRRDRRDGWNRRDRDRRRGGWR